MLGFALYEYRSCCLIFVEEYGTEGTSGPEKEVITRSRRKLHNEGVDKTLVIIIKSRKMRWMGIVARIE
jgi:hypothetical protein